MNTAGLRFRGKSVFGALFIRGYLCIYLHSFGTGALFCFASKKHVVVIGICDWLKGFSFENHF